jgi:hypothetical protein
MDLYSPSSTTTYASSRSYGDHWSEKMVHPTVTTVGFRGIGLHPFNPTYEFIELHRLQGGAQLAHKSSSGFGGVLGVVDSAN